MAEWMVGLSGHELDLQKLSELFSLPELGVTNEGNDYYIKSSDFEHLMNTNDLTDWRKLDPDIQERLRLDSNAVRSRAVELLGVMNGLGKMSAEGFQSVGLTDVLRIDEDGDRLHFKGLPLRLDLVRVCQERLQTAMRSYPNNLTKPGRGSL